MISLFKNDYNVMDLIFPLIILKANDSPIYVFCNKLEFGLVSPSGLSYYEDGTLYDSAGSVFELKGILSIHNASFLQCLKHFQRMKKVVPQLTYVRKIELPDFKNIIKQHISSYPEYWELKDELEELIPSIDDQNSIEEVISFLE
ncbi:hypothetical protein [Chitinophaga silvatica]|nr:hypothetical protein [Chitinophaga silvatica]